MFAERNQILMYQTMLSELARKKNKIAVLSESLRVLFDMGAAAGGGNHHPSQQAKKNDSTVPDQTTT